MKTMIRIYRDSILFTNPNPSGPSLNRRSMAERSDWKPCFWANTWKYGFSSFRSARMEFRRFGCMVSRRSLQMTGASCARLTIPSREYSDVKRTSAEIPSFSSRKRSREVFRSMSFSGFASKMAKNSSI